MTAAAAQALDAARAAFDAGDLARARAMAEQGAGANPNHSAWMFLLGQIKATGGEVESGVALMLAAQRPAPSWSELLVIAGFINRLAAEKQAPALQTLRQCVSQSEMLSNRLPLHYYGDLLSELAVPPACERVWLQAIHDAFVFPCVEQSLAAGRIDLAHYLTTWAYGALIEHAQGEPRAAALLARWRAPWRKIARTLARRWQVERADLGAQAKYRLAFLVPADAPPAHVDALILCLKDYQQQDLQPFRPMIVIMQGRGMDWRHRVAALDVEIAAIDDIMPGARFLARAEALVRLLSQQDVGAVVMMAHGGVLPFYFSLPLAPVQIWWAIQDHGYAGSEIDGYVTCVGETGTVIDVCGVAWRNAQIGDARQMSHHLDDIVQTRRSAHLGQRIIARLKAAFRRRRLSIWYARTNG